MGKLYRAIGCGGVFGSSVASLFRAADASETAAGREALRYVYLRAALFSYDYFFLSYTSRILRSATWLKNNVSLN
jgi:hypothetical protein